MTVRFSIGAKLIGITVIIALLSFGSIIALVSWLVREDLRIAAEEHNFEVNRRSATEAESVLANARSNSRILMRTVAAGGAGSLLARESELFFFQENPQIGAIFFTVGSASGGTLTNGAFFGAREIDPALSASYWDANAGSLMRAAAGETILKNAAPHFASPLLALFFPTDIGAGAVLFSAESLSDSFGSGINQSYLVNDAGDALVHTDFELTKQGLNMAEDPFIKYVWNHPGRNVQTLFENQEGVRYFAAFTKLNIAGAVVITQAEYDRVFEGIAATTRRNIYLTAAVLCVSIILIYFFSKSIANPLKELAAAARTIETGVFEVNLSPRRSRDEIGVLAASFRRMCAALTIFGKFTNRHVALGAMRGEIKPGGLPKRATILFTDIRGFTGLSENFTNAFGDESSNRIVLWLNEYFTHMVECVEKTGGAVDKFIGDAVMAHWGAVSSSGSARRDAYNCVAAALLMRNELLRMNRKRKPGDPGNPPIRIGCGINTGIVTAGQIGSETKMDYTVTGDPVNVASRLEEMNKTLYTDILISEDTWRLVRKKFILEEMQSVQVKGKTKPLRIFAVVNFAKAKRGPRSLTRTRKLLGILPPAGQKGTRDRHD